MVDALEEARFLWKLFDLNNSPNAGMEAYQDEKLIRKYGAVVAKRSDFSVCVTPVIDRSSVADGGGKPAHAGKRNRRAG